MEVSLSLCKSVVIMRKAYHAKSQEVSRTIHLYNLTAAENVTVEPLLYAVREVCGWGQFQVFNLKVVS